LELAKKMLFETNEKILVIARMTGFESPHHLCHVFRKTVGQTPKQYRLAHRRD
jgi:LacI family transcriptional regulator